MSSEEELVMKTKLNIKCTILCSILALFIAFIPTQEANATGLQQLKVPLPDHNVFILIPQYDADEKFAMREIIRAMTPENAECMVDNSKYVVMVQVWAYKQLRDFNNWYKTVPGGLDAIEHATIHMDPGGEYRAFLSKSKEVEDFFHFVLTPAAQSCLPDSMLDADEQGENNIYMQNLRSKMEQFEQLVQEEKELFLALVEVPRITPPEEVPSISA
jgi:hypothetical protein